MYNKIIFVLLVTAMTCGIKVSGIKESQNESKWSVKMANTVLAKSDSLIYYVDRNPKWAYDVAFLGMAIDRLGKCRYQILKIHGKLGQPFCEDLTVLSLTTN